MKKRNQRGFGAVEALLVLVIVAIIVFIGWFALAHGTSTDHAAARIATQAKTANKQPTQQTKHNSQKYLVIKQWGVEIPLTSGIADAYYKYDDSGSLAYLSTKSLASLDSQCGAGANAVGVSIISRESEAQHNADPAKGAANGFVKVDGYYYAYAQAQAACSGTIYTKASQEQGKDMHLFYTAFKSLKSVQ